MVLATLKRLRRGHIPCRFCRALAQTIHVHHDTVCWYVFEAAPLWPSKKGNDAVTLLRKQSNPSRVKAPLLTPPQ